MPDTLDVMILESAYQRNQGERYLRHLPGGSKQRRGRIDYEIVPRRDEFRKLRHGDGMNFRQNNGFRTADPRILT